MPKVHPEKVIPALARYAMSKTTERNAVYTEYIRYHWKQTGNLAPGCDARDLYAWLEKNMSDELKAITRNRS